MPQIDLKQQGSSVLIIVNGVLIEVMPWEKALEFSRALQHVGKLAEEYAKAEQIAQDGAILLRSGFPVPVGLTDNPKIKEEIAKEAAWNSHLRKCMPGGIKGEVIFGTPSIKEVKQPKLKDMSEEEIRELKKYLKKENQYYGKGQKRKR